MSTQLGTIIADFTTSLATAIAVSGTTATLQSATDDDGVALPAGRYFFTLDGTNSSKEHLSCDLSGTALTNIKTISRQGTETTGANIAHRIGATVTLTNFAHILYLNDLLDGTTDWNASVPLKYDGDPTISNDADIATKKYIDDVAIAGAADASTTTKGISKMSVAPASASNPIAVGDNDGRVLTQDENDAAAGSSGAPSSSNKYITAADVTEAKTASKIPRRDSNSDILVATTPTAGDAASSKTYVDAAVSGATSSFANGVTTRDLSTATGNQTIAHGLSGTPVKVKITVIQGDTSNRNASFSFGAYDGTNTNSIHRGENSNNQEFQGNSSTNVITIYDATTTGTAAQVATVSVDGTNITLAWTKSGSPTGTAQILWEAIA